jgi:hypothetical protein
MKGRVNPAFFVAHVPPRASVSAATRTRTVHDAHEQRARLARTPLQRVGRRQRGIAEVPGLLRSVKPTTQLEEQPSTHNESVPSGLVDVRIRRRGLKHRCIVGLV